MDLCILGGSGFVGSRLAARLGRAGHHLRVPTRRMTRGRHLTVLPTVRLIEADVTDPDALDRLFAGTEVVINLVGILNERGRDGSGFRAAHTALAGEIVAAARRQGVRKLVQVSALGANAESGPSHYLRSKGRAEQIIREAAAPDETGRNGLAWTIVQPSVIFGTGDDFVNRFARLLRQIPFAFPLAMPGTRFAPIHVDDVVTAIEKAALDRSTDNFVYELCGAEVYTLEEIVRKIATAAGTRRAILGLPRWASWCQAALMELVPGKPFSLDNYRSLKRHSVCAQNGVRALGITPRSFDRTLADCLPGGGPRAVLDSYRRDARRTA